ncbi:MAG: YitT family protein [Bacilli bacterium]|nr:YitT family protein [Bacilli bacterium]MDD4547809.1 YitT family protein [Bacilli bacterium]
MKTTTLTINQTIYRYVIFIIALLVLAATYNTFILPNNIVTGGADGAAVIFKEMIDPSLFVLIVNLILILASFFTLGKKTTLNSILGSILYPIFINLTSNINNFISIKSDDMILNIIFGSVLTGVSVGLIAKYGFSSGGSDIASTILAKLSKISMGKAFLIIDGSIILAGVFVFGIVNTMYAIIYIYIYSIVTDKIILGISDNKAFYIVTNKEKEVMDYILNNLHHGATLLTGQGAYGGSSKNVIFCVVSVRNYFRLKEGINDIDENAFFIVADAYEVKGGA